MSLNTSHNDLRIAHLNVCSLQNKMDEIRLLQTICRFDILAISHLNSSIPDNILQILVLNSYAATGRNVKAATWLCIMLSTYLLFIVKI